MKKACEKTKVRPLSAREVGRRLHRIHLRKIASTDRHAAEIRALNAEMKEVRSRCQHDWKMIPDPAGGRTEYVCKDCDLWK